MYQSDRRYGGVRPCYCRPLAAEIMLEQAGQARYRPCLVIILETSEELFRGGRFSWAHTRIYFNDVDRAAGQQMSLFNQTQQEIATTAFVVEDINNDAGIEEVGCHLPVETPVQALTAFLRCSFTQRAAPPLSSV